MSLIKEWISHHNLPIDLSSALRDFHTLDSSVVISTMLYMGYKIQDGFITDPYRNLPRRHVLRRATLEEFVEFLKNWKPSSLPKKFAAVLDDFHVFMGELLDFDPDETVYALVQSGYNVDVDTGFVTRSSICGKVPFECIRFFPDSVTSTVRSRPSRGPRTSPDDYLRVVSKRQKKITLPSSCTDSQPSSST